jgi:streptogramin lyase
VCDQEANRRFLEDVLGIPLVATWCEKSWRAEIDREVEFCHTFFSLADGGALAFFQFADPEVYALTQAEKPQISSHYHIALKVGEATYADLKHRLDRAGERFRETDHGYCKSIYTTTPDGMMWYVDEPRGFLGRINPKMGEAKEWQAPGGPGSRPYALTKDDQGRLWFSETGTLKQLVGFDPKTEKFFSVNTVSGNIRHMQFHAPTKSMWFGTDANKIGRIITTTAG